MIVLNNFFSNLPPITHAIPDYIAVPLVSLIWHITVCYYLTLGGIDSDESSRYSTKQSRQYLYIIYYNKMMVSFLK